MSTVSSPRRASSGRATALMQFGRRTPQLVLASVLLLLLSAAVAAGAAAAAAIAVPGAAVPGAAVPGAAVPGAAVKLWRLDCGAFIAKHLVNSCYLIRHGASLMLWDTGFATDRLARTDEIRTGASLASQLARIGISPSQISLVALSHLHWDHVGQAGSFPTATLLVGKQDWDAMMAMSQANSSVTASGAAPGINVEPHSLAQWVEGHAPKTLVAGDQDIFGDGSVIMLATPGHTPGHHSLLVRLSKRGPVLLTGDLYHSALQFKTKVVPRHDYNSEQTAESFKRFDALAQTLSATIIIQHEPQDVTKLPRFPKPAE